MMDSVIASLVEFLSSGADPLLGAGRMGSQSPTGPGDVPAVVMSLTVDSTAANGIGSFLREGHQLTRNTAIVAVQAGPDSFSADLKTLPLPSPLRNPGDVQVGRVQGPSQIVPYRLTATPATVEEFRVDSLNEKVIFGAPQPAGAQLQVSSWTIVFRDDITGARSSGAINLEVWGGSSAELSTLAGKLQTKLYTDRAGLRQSGFGVLQPAGLSAAESIAYQPGTGSAFPVWKQTLTYKFHFDFEQGGDASSGGPIRKINIGLPAENESFSTPAGS